MSTKLKIWRKSEGLTQEQAADRCGVNQPTWCKWENGRVSVEEALRVHGVTKIPLHELRPDIYPAPKKTEAA